MAKTKKADETKTRTIRIQSPAGPVHILTGFVDDGAETLDITGLPESEWGHWAPYYALTVNGQAVTLARITPTFEDANDA